MIALNVHACGNCTEYCLNNVRESGQTYNTVEPGKESRKKIRCFMKNPAEASLFPAVRSWRQEPFHLWWNWSPHEKGINVAIDTCGLPHGKNSRPSSLCGYFLMISRRWIRNATKNDRSGQWTDFGKSQEAQRTGARIYLRLPLIDPV